MQDCIHAYNSYKMSYEMYLYFTFFPADKKVEKGNKKFKYNKKEKIQPTHWND